MMFFVDRFFGSKAVFEFCNNLISYSSGVIYERQLFFVIGHVSLYDTKWCNDEEAG